MGMDVMEMGGKPITGYKNSAFSYGRKVHWDGTINNQPHIHLILRGYLLGIFPFKELGLNSGPGPPSQGYHQGAPRTQGCRVPNTVSSPQELLP